MVDLDEGTTLDFIPAPKINGIKWAKLAQEDIEEEVNYWKNTVICCVLGANPPYEVLAGYVKRIWKEYAIDKILLIKKVLYVVRFPELQDALTVAQRGIYHFDDKPFIIKAWNLELEINIDAISSLPIWIQLPELDIKYWDCKVLVK